MYIVIKYKVEVEKEGVQALPLNVSAFWQKFSSSIIISNSDSDGILVPVPDKELQDNDETSNDNDDEIISDNNKSIKDSSGGKYNRNKRKKVN